MVDFTSTIGSMLDKNITWTKFWVPLTVLATITAITLNAVFLMFARAFHMEELERYAKGEMLQAGATALMAVFLVMILGAITNSEFLSGFVVSGKATCDGTEYVYASGQYGMGDALELVRCRLEEKAVSLGNILEYANSDHAWDFDRLTLSFSLLGIPVFNGNYVESWYLTVENYRALQQLSLNLLISVNAQMNFVDYVAQTMLRLFLPIGIILRSFYFTRGMGAFFISIAIGLYFIFPTVFMITDPTFVKTQKVSVPSVSEKRADFCYPTFTGSVALVQNAGTTSSGGSGGGYGMTTTEAVTAVSRVYTGMLLHPFITLAITLIFVRYLMAILGGEPYDVMRLVARVV